MELLSHLEAGRSRIVGITAGALFLMYISYKRITSPDEVLLAKERKKRLIVITGCDSGLGHSMAVWAAKLGYKVLAGCLHENGEGAAKLRAQFPVEIVIKGLDVREASSLLDFQETCRQLLEQHDDRLYLWALVANAAVATIGEYFWQTQSQREQQMNVNFWGTVNFIDTFRTLLLKNKCRVLIISSDCSEYPFPTLAAYSASKAALQVWTQSFRMEVAKYGVHVVAFQPRDFITSSALLSNVQHHYNEMAEEMSDFDKKFNGEYFHKFMKNKVKFFARNVNPSVIVPLPSAHQKVFFRLLEGDIRNIAVYRDNSLGEKVLHVLCNCLPQRYVDNLMIKLINPKLNEAYWKEPENEST